MGIKNCLRHATVLFVLFVIMTIEPGCAKEDPPPPAPPTLQRKIEEGWNKHKDKIIAVGEGLAIIGIGTAIDADPKDISDGLAGVAKEYADNRSRRQDEGPKQTDEEGGMRGILDAVAAVLKVVGVCIVGLLALCAVFMLIICLSRPLWKLIKFTFWGLVVRLPRKLWKEKLYIPSLPMLLQVKKFRRPNVWMSNIPWGLLIINLILWLCDVTLCVLCLCCNLCFLFLLVPALILTYYVYIGVYWARIAIIVLLVLLCPVCGACIGDDWFTAMFWVSIGLIVLLFLPKSNAWFRKQNSDLIDANATEKNDGSQTP